MTNRHIPRRSGIGTRQIFVIKRSPMQRFGRIKVGPSPWRPRLIAAMSGEKK